MKSYTYYRHNKCSKVFMTLRMFRLLISSICHSRDVMTPPLQHRKLHSNAIKPQIYKFGFRQIFSIFASNNDN